MRLFFLIGLLSIVANAKIHTESVLYKEGDTTLEGFVAYDTQKTNKRPGVLIVHEWTGLGDYVKRRATELAKLGYVAFAADIYGQGVRPAQSEAGKVSSLYKSNRTLFRARLTAALNELKKQKYLNSKIAAIGYCFGGTGVLELARSGADIQGVVSFHGGLNTPNAEDAKNIKAKVLVLHGADDPYVPGTELKAFEDEMNAAKVDWQLVKYSGAVHAFTNTAAGNDVTLGAAYNEKADHRSWVAMLAFFTELFK